MVYRTVFQVGLLDVLPVGVPGGVPGSLRMFYWLVYQVVLHVVLQVAYLILGVHLCGLLCYTG